MPFGRFGIEVQGAAPPLKTVCKFALTKSSCKPTLNTLQLFSSVLNGPAAVLLMPSGNKGRCRNPPARSVNATEPLSCNPSAAARSTYDPNPAARRNASAFAPQQNAAARAL